VEPDKYLTKRGLVNKDIKSAEQCKLLREFAHEYEIENYFEIGKMGIEHALLPEKGLILPGDIVVGADSHTDTSGALGAFAIGVGSTDLAAIMVLGEVWLKVPPTIKFVYSGKLNKWVSGKDLILYTISKIGVDGARPYQIYKSDTDAHYEKIIEIDVSKIEPQVAFPHLPENAKPISEAKGIKIDQSIIGSCTNGRVEDLRIAAEILKGQQVHSEVRLIIIPATQDVYLQALREGLIDIFISSGAAVSTPTCGPCGPCLGGYMGILAKGERAISTTNRNFVGRMGHPESEVYLASPAIAAASAILGRIASPEEVK